MEANVANENMDQWPEKKENMIRRSVDYRQDLTNQIRLCQFLVGDTPHFYTEYFYRITICKSHWHSKMYRAPVPIAGVPLLVALAGVVQQDVVLERVGDEPPGGGVVTTVLNAVLLLRQLEELFHWDGFTGRYHQQAWDGGRGFIKDWFFLVMTCQSHGVSRRCPVGALAILRDSQICMYVPYMLFICLNKNKKINKTHPLCVCVCVCVLRWYDIVLNCTQGLHLWRRVASRHHIWIWTTYHCNHKDTGEVVVEKLVVGGWHGLQEALPVGFKPGRRGCRHTEQTKPHEAEQRGQGYNTTSQSKHSVLIGRQAPYHEPPPWKWAETVS